MNTKPPPSVLRFRLPLVLSKGSLKIIIPSPQHIFRLPNIPLGSLKTFV
ncbi:hypothetical protein [Kingella oralis]|nr:hypothetical protein [Kingella oralis]